MKKSPMAMTADRFHALGFHCGTVERNIPRMPIKVDLFGFIDMIAINHHYTLGLQVTTPKNHSTRMKKAQAQPKFIEWLSEQGRSFMVISWQAKKVEGQRALLPVMRVTEAIVDMREVAFTSGSKFEHYLHWQEVGPTYDGSNYYGREKKIIEI